MTTDHGPRLLGVRFQSIVAALAVLLATLTSGNLECTSHGDSQAVAHGRELYGRMCSVCHGVAGEGYKADQAPALAQQDFLASVSDRFLVTAITNGRAGSTMSAWGVEHGGPLVPEEVTAVVEFLRTWQTVPSADLDERQVKGDPLAGAALYRANCAECHGARGTGGTYIAIGNPELLAAASNGFLRHAIRVGRPGAAMPAFRTKLGDDGIENILAVIRQWQTPPPGNAPPRLAAPAKPPPLPLGPVPLNPRGPEPVGFDSMNGFTHAEVVKRELDRGARMGILDARAPSDYANDHIIGAVSVPFYDPEPYVNQLPKDAWLVAYCGCPHAESGQLATKLRAKGFKKVTVIDEGLRYWSSNHWGTRRGTLP